MLRGKALTLCQVLRLASKCAEAELGEVGHEDVVEVDQDASGWLGLMLTMRRAIRTESV